MRSRIALLLIATFYPTILPAQLTIGPEGPRAPKTQSQPNSNTPQIYKLAITPAPEPVPALKYRFDVPLVDQTSGNSVPFYYRAIVSWLWQPQEPTKTFQRDLDRWSELPLDELPLDEIRETIPLFGNLLQELERATLSDQTDWGWHWERLSGSDWLQFTLTEIQEARGLAKLLRAKARLEIAEGRFDDAAKTIRMGYILAEDISTPPGIIAGLVGTAAVGIMDITLIDWIGRPNSPNLYWALASLPDPVVDYRPAIEFEMTIYERFVPWLKDVEQNDVPPAVWRERFTQAFQDLFEMTGEGLFWRAKPDSTEALLQPSLSILFMSFNTYPLAKALLIEQGREPHDVEAMPVGKVLAIRQKQIDDEIAQRMITPSLLAPQDMLAAAERAKTTVGDLQGWNTWQGQEPVPLLAFLVPSVHNVILADLRSRARNGGLKAIEAVRMHAAETGSLPATLDEIKVVPVPSNPLTGEPFPYQLDDDTAIINIIVDPRTQAVNWQVELTLKK